MKKPEHNSAGFSTNSVVRLGTDKAPAKLTVQSEARKQELQAVLDESNWVGVISVDAEQAENIQDLDILQGKKATEAAVSTKQASRNDPCPCGSGKKYKKCCAA